MFSRELTDILRKLPTPFYFYETDLLHKTLFAIKEAADLFQYQIHYAVKANANAKVLKLISNYGFGADCVSAYEIERALSCGFEPHKIVFAGVGKTDLEIEYAIKKNILCINCESVEELDVVNTIANKLNKRAKVALRINPDVDAETHRSITTGLGNNKFGLSFIDLKQVVSNVNRYEHLIIDGLHFHIGSQITNLKVFENLCRKVNEIQDYLQKYQFYPAHINLGGGLGIDYQYPENQVPDFYSYLKVFHQNLRPGNGQTIHFEPGRSIVGQCGILVCKALYVKNNESGKLVIVDAGFTELIRTALYQAQHKIINLNSTNQERRYDIAGPICETSDYFGKSVLLPETKRGDLIGILSAGAYGEVMASQYNLRPIVKSYFSDELTNQTLSSKSLKQVV